MTGDKSSGFTDPAFGPPMIGALLRMPWERVVQRMLERLHEQGFDAGEGDAAGDGIADHRGTMDANKPGRWH